MRSHACKPRRVSRPARACLILGGGQLEVLDARLCHPASKVQAVCLARYGGRRRGLQGIGDGPRRRAVGSGDSAAVGPSTAQGAHWPIAAPQPSRPNLEHLIPLGLLVRQADEATPLRRGVFGQAPQSASGAGAQVGVAAPRARLELSHLVTAPIPTHTHKHTRTHPTHAARLGSGTVHAARRGWRVRMQGPSTAASLAAAFRDGSHAMPSYLPPPQRAGILPHRDARGSTPSALAGWAMGSSVFGCSMGVSTPICGPGASAGLWAGVGTE